MTLSQNDVGWYLPERPRDDTDDGGGEMTLTPLVEGEQSNLFNDVDDIARIYGEASIQLAYPAVVTANRDALRGPHFYLAEVPTDPNAGLLIGYAGGWGARRSAIADLIARYLAKGPRYMGWLWETQVAGARVITLFQSPDNPYPAVGDTLCLVQAEGLPGSYEEYVRVAKVTTALRNFTDSDGKYARLIVTVEVTAPLEHDYDGAQIHRYDNVEPDAIVRTTVVADAVRFYGSKPLVQPSSLGATHLVVSDIYEQIVPSSQAEVPITDLDGQPFQTQLVQIGPARRLATGVTGGAIQIGRPLMPGTVTVTGPATLVDTGLGSANNGAVTAVIDYRAGIVTPPYAGAWSVDAAPAAPVMGAAYTYGVPITSGNRGYVWTLLLPAGGQPAAGSMRVDYRSMGKWYAIADRGDRRLTSDGAGSGTIISDTVTVTMTALPDIGSLVLFTWSSPAIYTRADTAQLPDPVYEFTLEPGMVPDETSVAWTVAGQPKTASDNVNGEVTGDASGLVIGPPGLVYLRLPALPDPGTEFGFTYQTRQAYTGTLSLARTDAHTLSGTIDAAALPLVPGAVRLQIPYQYDYYPGGARHSSVLVLDDNGSGGWKLTPLIEEGGALNYNSGQFTVQLKQEVPL